MLIEVADDRSDDLTAALRELSGLLTITPYRAVEPAEAAPGDKVTFTVLGNDRPGIVRDITGALVGGGLTIDRFTSRTVAAPMAGGELFEATVTVRAAGGAELAAAVAELERLAGEIQVDLTLA
ncbi:amino acid-binding ACT protein [Microbacterium elymi]|uniref:amino acid-binding ACT protein n=1 Tax=Microbacterium elymi TaxID=2909587 RepID=UPI00338D704A